MGIRTANTNKKAIRKCSHAAPTMDKHQLSSPSALKIYFNDTINQSCQVSVAYRNHSVMWTGMERSFFTTYSLLRPENANSCWFAAWRGTGHWKRRRQTRERTREMTEPKFFHIHQTATLWEANRTLQRWMQKAGRTIFSVKGKVTRLGPLQVESYNSWGMYSEVISFKSTLIPTVWV